MRNATGFTLIDECVHGEAQGGGDPWSAEELRDAEEELIKAVDEFESAANPHPYKSETNKPGVK